MDRVFLIADDHGVAGVGAAVVADNDIVLRREEIDNFALALIAPLQADHGGVRARTGAQLGWGFRTHEDRRTISACEWFGRQVQPTMSR